MTQGEFDLFGTTAPAAAPEPSAVAAAARHLGPKQSQVIARLKQVATITLTEAVALIGQDIYANRRNHVGAVLSNMVDRGLIVRVTPGVFALPNAAAGTLPVVESSATISPCGRYRYDLVRKWGTGPHVLFVCLNPSTADGTQDDPTIRKCRGYAQRWGYDGLVMCNLFAYRATDPAELHHVDDPVGPDNDRYLAMHIAAAKTVILAWGTEGNLRQRAEKFLQFFPGSRASMQCLRITSRGFPNHPLYLPDRLTPIPYA